MALGVDTVEGLPTRTVSGYGWVRDSLDARDKFRVKAPSWLSLPSAYRISTSIDPYDQGQLGSCTANGIGFAYEFAKNDGITPSRLFVYYNERVIEHTIHSDSGAQIRDGFKVIAAKGCPPETEWPYDISQFAVKPPKNVYADGMTHQVLTYEAVAQDELDIKAALFARKPVVFGFSVYASFETDAVAKTGYMPMPDVNKEQLLGGHCVVLVGWDDNKKVYVVRNSWGSGWGDKGYFYMPYDYAHDGQLASDFWCIDSVE